MTRWRRWGKATKAALLGWVVAVLAASPILMVQVVRSSGHDFQLVMAALGFSLTVWLLLTFAGVLVVWLCIVSPIALFCPEAPLLLHRKWVMAAAILASVLAVSYLAHAWTYVERSGAGALNVWAGICFAAVFAAVTSYYYLYFLKRILR